MIQELLWIHKNPYTVFVDPQNPKVKNCESTNRCLYGFFSHKIGGNAAHFFLPYQKNTDKIAHF